MAERTERRSSVTVALVASSAVAVSCAVGVWGFQVAMGAPATSAPQATAANAAEASSVEGGQAFTEADIKWLGIKLAMSDFPVNDRGQTYGSSAQTGTLETMPDLVGVVGNNGYEGFVEKRHLVEPEPRNPAEARRIGRAMRKNPPGPVPVYALDGTTQLDVFTPFVAGTGKSSH